MFISRLVVCYSYVCSFIEGAWGSGLYQKILFFLLLSFVLFRFPYIYGMGGFGVYLFFVVFPLFLSLFTGRLGMGISGFLSSFVPLGTPLWIAPFVCLAETLSYLVRPMVLMIRPFVNLSIGCLGGHVLGSMVFLSEWVVLGLLVLFFYEVFVALVHWFIVCNILSFSEDH